MPAVTTNSCNQTITQYNVQTGSATNTLNQVAPGASGTVLTSNGASSQPTFQAASSGFVVGSGMFFGQSPADATTYYFIPTGLSTTITAVSKIYIPITGTITIAYGSISVRGTLGSAQNTTIALRLNDTTNTNVTTTLSTSSAVVAFNNTSLGMAVSAGDFVSVIMITPTWVTNPTNMDFQMSFYMT